MTALEMRKDLKHWDQAMKLAGALAPEALPDINREYGAQLEMKGDHSMALQCYERALEDGRALSEAAVARCEASPRPKSLALCGLTPTKAGECTPHSNNQPNSPGAHLALPCHRDAGARRASRAARCTWAICTAAASCASSAPTLRCFASARRSSRGFSRSRSGRLSYIQVTQLTVVYFPVKKRHFAHSRDPPPPSPPANHSGGTVQAVG